MKRTTVILADDHTVVREGFRRILELDGDIEIVGGRGSAPTVRLSGRAAELAAELETDEVVISMTHEGDLASAVAIASRRCGCAQS